MPSARGPKRLRLRAWLVQQIDEGLIPGLSWLNKEGGLFKVPWKHASRHSYDKNKDPALFREWAKYTGKFRPGSDKEDSRKWKTNFRCALNALPDVSEIKEESDKKGKDAYKVYRIDRNRQRAKVTRRLTSSNQQRNRKKKVATQQHPFEDSAQIWVNAPYNGSGSPYGQLRYPWTTIQGPLLDYRARSEVLGRYPPQSLDQEVPACSNEEDIAKLVDELMNSGVANADRNIDALYSSCSGVGTLWTSDQYFPTAGLTTRLCHYGDHTGIISDGPQQYDDPMLNSRI